MACGIFRSSFNLFNFTGKGGNSQEVVEEIEIVIF
jgi:hypothetical protein